MSEPKISVIIPTRERCDVLEKCLRTVTAQNYSNLDIIVSDNFSTDNTRDVVHSADDARVRYINTGKRLSMSHNWEFALSNAGDTGWVTIVGDDDGLLPGSLNKIAEIIQSTDVLAVRAKPCTYRWPSMTKTGSGDLVVPLRSGHELRQTSRWLGKVLSGDATFAQLPLLYTGGFVSMSVLKEIKSRTGVVYKSCIPDVYSAVAISSVIDRYIFSHEPLAINGVSRHSIGKSQFSKKDNSALSPAEKFVSEGNLPFHEDIPLCSDGHYPKSFQIMVYESYLQSRCLRSVADANMHAEQLEVILATSGRHDTVINEWGAEFARMHGLDYDFIRTKARRRKAVLDVTSITRLASLAMNTHIVGSTEEPIKDVFEASIVAAAIRADIPGPTKRLLGLVRHAIKMRQES
jgi:glycosyltransferase involved in cell wall biosynthesis